MTKFEPCSQQIADAWGKLIGPTARQFREELFQAYDRVWLAEIQDVIDRRGSNEQEKVHRRIVQRSGG